MSRSNPTPQNPAQHFMEWSGSEGTLNWYSKEQQKRINVPLPFEFLVLDELSTITGYSKRDQSGYWSNEVRNITKDELTVRTKHGTAQVGLYKDLADVRAKGAKYAKSIYIIHKKSDGEWIMGNLKAVGSALSAWIEFSGTCVVQNGKVRMTKGAKEEAPTGDFYPPVFEYLHADADEDYEAIAQDKILQVYLSQYLARQVEPEVAAPEPEDNETTTDKRTDIGQGTPSRSNSIEGVQNKDKAGNGAEGITIEDLEGEPVNLDEIPF